MIDIPQLERGLLPPPLPPRRRQPRYGEIWEPCSPPSRRRPLQKFLPQLHHLPPAQYQVLPPRHHAAGDAKAQACPSVPTRACQIVVAATLEPEVLSPPEKLCPPVMECPLERPLEMLRPLECPPRHRAQACARA